MTDRIFAQKGGVRVVPFEEPQSSSQGNSNAANSNINPLNGLGNSPDVGSTVAGNGNLSPEDIAELQAAADAGDEEAFDLLRALGIAGGVVGGMGASYALIRALERQRGPSAGMPMDPNAVVPNLPATHNPDVINLDWETVERPLSGRQQAIPGMGTAPTDMQLETGQPARVQAAPQPKQITHQQPNNENLPVRRDQSQKAVEEDLAYRQAHQQNVKVGRAREGANPGRSARHDALRKAAAAFRRIR